MDYPKTVPNVNLLAGQFTDGDPANGVPASLDPADWANGVTQEILNVLSAAGIAPIENTNNQLLAALKTLLLGPGGTSATDFVTIPYRDKTTGALRNFIIQWGVMNTTTAAPGTITFPIAFPNACLVAIPSDWATSWNDQQVVKFAPPTATSVAWYGSSPGGTQGALNAWVWFAFGY